MSLITLKDSITIAHLATKLDYNGAKTAVESILGKIPDLSDLTDEQAKQVILTLSERIERNDRRNKIIQTNTFTPSPTREKTKGKSKKKEIMVID